MSEKVSSDPSAQTSTWATLSQATPASGAVEVTGFPILKRGGQGSRRVGVGKSGTISFFPLSRGRIKWDKVEPLQIHEKIEGNRRKK